MLKALRNEETPATQEDAERLRDALVAVLDHRAERRRAANPKRPPADVKQLREMTTRLSRFPAPTGLSRKLSSLLIEDAPAAPRKEQRGDELAEAVSESAESLLTLAMRVALPEDDLEAELRRLQGLVRPRMGLGDTRRLTREVRAALKSAVPIRARFMACREACVDLLQALSRQLEEGRAANDRVSRRSGDLADVVSRHNDPAAISELKEALLMGLSEIQADTSKVHRALGMCEDRVSALESELDTAREALVEARDEASRDPLTGALNRRGYDPLLADAVLAAHQRGKPLCLLMVDLDHFKNLNDTYGHPAGDMVLRVASQTFRDCLRDRDVVARVGGEEFAVLLPDTDADVASRVADRLRETLARKVFVSGRRRFSVTASMGLAALRPSDSPDTLTERADTALYKAKDSGRNCCWCA